MHAEAAASLQSGMYTSHLLSENRNIIGHEQSCCEAVEDFSIFIRPKKQQNAPYNVYRLNHCCATLHNYLGYTTRQRRYVRPLFTRPSSSRKLYSSECACVSGGLKTWCAYYDTHYQRLYETTSFIGREQPDSETGNATSYYFDVTTER